MVWGREREREREREGIETLIQHDDSFMLKD